jgi:hypothetical protein
MDYAGEGGKRYECYTKVELKERAKAKGIVVPAKILKADLIAMLRSKKPAKAKSPKA